MLTGLKDHTVVVGLNRVSFSTIETLKSLGEKVIAVEKNRKKIEEFKKLFPAVDTVEGDAKEEEILELAALKYAKRILINTSSDSENMFITVTARQLNPKIFICSRVVKPENEIKLKKAGADTTFLPEVLSGRSVALSLLKPEIAEFIREVLLSENTPYLLESVEVSKKSSLNGRMLKDFYNEEIFGLLLAIVKEGRVFLNPKKSMTIKEGDKLIVLGNLEQIENLTSALTI